MKNALIVLSIPADSRRTRDILPITADSVRSYCERHGIELIRLYDLGDLLIPGVPHCERLKLLPYFDEFDRLIYLDDTCIVAPNCPNLFDLVPPDKLGCVVEPLDLFPDRERMLSDVLDLYDVPTSNRQYFNAGMLVLSQRHRVLFENNHLIRPSKQWDQSFLNAMVNKFDLEILDLGLAYNYLGSLIHRNMRTNFNGQKIFIYHLTRGCCGEVGRLDFGRAINERIAAVEAKVESVLERGHRPGWGLSRAIASDVLREIVATEACNLLVLGRGPDDEMWREANPSGRTTFVEWDQCALPEQSGKGGTDVPARLDGLTRRTEEHARPEPIFDTTWDVVIIQQPPGSAHAKDRAVPIYWACSLLKKDSSSVVYLDGPTALEKAFCDRLLGAAPRLELPGERTVLKIDASIGVRGGTRAAGRASAATVGARKLVFVFIARYALSEQRLWEQFFRDADPQRYDCLYYSIHDGPAPNIRNISRVRIDAPPRYGHVTYVQTVLRMLQRGLEDPRNYKFILLSETCVPLKSFASIYSEVMGEEGSYLYHFAVGTGEEGVVTDQTTTEFPDAEARQNPEVSRMFWYFFGRGAIEDTSDRYEEIIDKTGIDRAKFVKFQAQGICFQRDFAEFLLATQDDLENYREIRFLEEHYYLCPLNKRGIPFDRYVRRKHLMAVVWRGSRPRLHSELSTTLIAQMRRLGFCFLRKVADTCQIDDDLLSYLLERRERRPHPVPATAGGGPRNLVLAYCTGYGREVYERFIGTLFDTGFTGRLVVFIGEEDRATIAGLDRTHPDDVLFVITRPMRSRKYDRYWIYLDYLTRAIDLDTIERMFLCDARDVIFQRNVFDYPMDPACDLAVFEEDATIGECRWNSTWMKRFGDEAFEQLKDRRVLCSGTILGKRAAIIRYLQTMIDILTNEVGLDAIRKLGPNAGGDQGVFNYLFHTDRLPQLNIKRFAPDDPLCVTIHHSTPHVNDEGKVVDRRGNPFWCVHQFDRLPRESLRKLDRLSTKYDLTTRFGTKPGVGANNVQSLVGVEELSEHVQKEVSRGAAPAVLDGAAAECIFSDRFRFICLLLPGNACDTLRGAFTSSRYAGRVCRYALVAPEKRERYFTFAFLRDPVQRLLSAYRHLSLRGEAIPPSADRRFFAMDDSEERFLAFLKDAMEPTWDPRLQRQGEYLAGVRVDFFGSVETLREDLEEIARRVDPIASSISSGACADDETSGDRRFRIREDDLSPEAIRRITQIYRADIRLYVQEIVHEHARTGRLLKLYRAEETDSRCIVHHLRNSGFYAELTLLVRSMVYAFAHRLRVAVDSTKFALKIRDGLSDYFEELLPEFHPSMEESVVGHITQREMFLKIRYFEVDKIVVGGVPIRGFENILGAFLKMAFRPNVGVRAEMDRLAADLGLPSPYACIHVRRGDKVGDEDFFYPAELYLQALETMGARDQPIFVMSDDYEAVRELRRCLLARRDSRRIHTLCRDEHRGFDQEAMRRGEFIYSSRSGRTAKPIDFRAHVYGEMVRLLTETVLAAKAQAFVGTHRSSVGRVVRLLAADPERCVLLKAGALKNFNRERGVPSERDEFQGDAGRQRLLTCLRRQRALARPGVSIDVRRHEGRSEQALDEASLLLACELAPGDQTMKVAKGSTRCFIQLHWVEASATASIGDAARGAPSSPGDPHEGRRGPGLLDEGYAVATLDEAVALFGLQGHTIQLLTIDTGGSNVLVLRGTEKSLDRVRCLFFECSDGGVDSKRDTNFMREAIEVLAARGFTVYRAGAKRLLRVDSPYRNEAYERNRYRSHCFAIKSGDPLLEKIVDTGGFYVEPPDSEVSGR